MVDPLVPVTRWRGAAKDKAMKISTRERWAPEHETQSEYRTERGSRSAEREDTGQPSSEEEAAEEREPTEAKSREGENHGRATEDHYVLEADIKMPRKKEELKYNLRDPR
ncbi:hypothetical protein NDU88_002025 [Pleurodeles waltl]|uniref:Uncharacterized protein n=1 Tax=Pleurodeles waltl TaxID=8319 RepID=A0AAV7KRM3_PLEWA|nr:hypothetical protein NDU88_002025 [Pleurodeles waltl]